MFFGYTRGVASCSYEMCPFHTWGLIKRSLNRDDHWGNVTLQIICPTKWETVTHLGARSIDQPPTCKECAPITCNESPSYPFCGEALLALRVCGAARRTAPRGTMASRSGMNGYVLWMDEILHHFETMGSDCLLLFTGESFIPGFLS